MFDRLKSFWSAIDFRFRKYSESQYRKKVRKKITNQNFSIISSNCWGGGVYETLGIGYNTPTIGLFFYAPCYIRFIKNLKHNVDSELTFIDRSRYEVANDFRKQSFYPIGLLDGEIEVHFLHYRSEVEAAEKWLRRKQRVNFDNLFFSFTDRDLCTSREIESFNALPYNKVFFSAKNIAGIKSLIFLPQFAEAGIVGDLYSNPSHYRKYFNYVKWLNR